MERKLQEVSLVENYVERVQFLSEKFKNHQNLITDSQVLPERINKALAEWLAMNETVIDEYKRKQVELLEAETKFKSMFDKHYLDVESELKGSKDFSASKPPTQKTVNATVYQRFPELKDSEVDIDVLKIEVGKYRRYADMLKSYKDILICISTNMRTELKVLGVIS